MAPVVLLSSQSVLQLFSVHGRGKFNFFCAIFWLDIALIYYASIAAFLSVVGLKIQSFYASFWFKFFEECFLFVSVIHEHVMWFSSNMTVFWFGISLLGIFCWPAFSICCHFLKMLYWLDQHELIIKYFKFPEAWRGGDIMFIWQ